MNWFFDYSLFIPRTMCGPGWSRPLALVNQLSNLFIALPYFTIAICLFMLWVKIRLSHINSYILLFFVAFIALCGWTHLNQIIAFHYPMYRFFTFIELVTATVSTTTAIILPIVVKRFLDQYKTFNSRLENMHRQIRNLEAVIRKR